MKKHTENASSDRGAKKARSGRSFRAGLLAGGLGLAALIAGSAGIAAADTIFADDAVLETPTGTTVPNPADGGVGIEQLDAAWAEFDACFEEHLAGLDTEFDAEPDADLEADLEAAFEAADEACSDLLPEDAFAEYGMAGEFSVGEWDDVEWQAFDQCMDNELSDLDDMDELFPTSVWIADDNGENLVVFGDEVGSVTISGTAEAVNIDADGVEVFTGEKLDELFAEQDAEIEALFAEAEDACGDLLPEDDAFWFEFGELDDDFHGELDDEGYGEEDSAD